MPKLRSSQTFTGSRGWSVFGSVLLLPISIGMPTFAAHLLVDDRPIAGLFIAALALFMLVHSSDWLARSVRPNRLDLDETGLTLTTWRGTERWPWSAFRGIYGMGFQMLRVDVAGRRRAVQIGHWQRDLALHVHAVAERHGFAQAGPGYERPSAAPLFVLSGAMLLATLAFAWFSLAR